MVADLDDLLEKTSRTFALTIPVLPEPTRREVMIAYLLFRIADTLEDAAMWSRQRRIDALRSFAAILSESDAAAIDSRAKEWSAAVPIDHPGYQELMIATPYVVEQFGQLGDRSQEIIREHTVRTTEGMAEYVARTDNDGHLELRDVEDLKAYCYVVAGIVGEMLTELFLRGRDRLAAVAAELRSHSVAFGEALQLVNILKDSAFDSSEGRSYLPANASRDQVFALARHDLREAAAYVLTMQKAGAPDGLVKFTALPVLLARATLDKVERSGPGAKIGRPHVFAIIARLDRALSRGRPALAAV